MQEDRCASATRAREVEQARHEKFEYRDVTLIDELPAPAQDAEITIAFRSTLVEHVAEAMRSAWEQHGVQADSFVNPSQVDGRNLVVHVDCEDAPATAGAAC